MLAICDRRQWLKTSAAACAATLVERRATAQQPTPGAGTSRPLRKAIKFSMLKENLPIADKFKLIKDLGFEGVEIHTQNMPDRQEVLRAIEATGLPVHGVLNSSNPDIRSAIDLARYWGATSVLVVAGKVDAKTSYDANYRQTQKLIRDAAEHAAQQQIRLLVDWAAVRQAITEIGYHGWATAEVRGGDRTRLADIAKRMDRLLGNAEG